MELRQWESCLMEEKSKNPITILGLGWDKETDELYCRVKVTMDINSMVVTKRAVLSISASVFDPVGVLCLATITPRIMLQQAWVQKVAWNEPWDRDVSAFFCRWYGEIGCLEEVRIKRYVSAKKDPEKMQLHCFVDASKDAYAACVYLRSCQENGVTVALLAAKSRSAPLYKEGTKRITIPRLELMGCLVGARLVTAVTEGMTVQGVPTTMWSDSATALSWITRHRPWGPFVENRVEEIRKLVPETAWRHVPGELNPADLPSRECNPKQLKESRWWEGPSWLRCPKDQWPSCKVTVNEEEVVKGADELSLHLSRVAYVVNSRPLTTVTEDPDDLRPLTPFMFLRSLPFGGMPERDLISQRDLQRGHQYILTMRQALKARFRKEYLGLLIQRGNEKPTPSPQVGDVVLVGFDNRKRYEWPLAKIKKLIKGTDGNVRVAIVKTVTGELVRPLQRLYPLEVPKGMPESKTLQE